ncbi:hypothetical protein [Fulvimonas yonginensis]|uniref:Carbohydrate-binding domain-containing protein n=1 Tax=Fulvimonas yonginensis TaxID=1495200 RepID=A0ABU8JB24_9GAMM
MFLPIVLSAAASLAQPIEEPVRPAVPLFVPRGLPVLLDGRIDGAEWGDAAEIRLAHDVRLLLKHDGRFVYAAVVLPAPRVFGVNLYLARDGAAGAYLNLHASARLGERSGYGKAWPEWRWWNNSGWTANVARFNGFEGQRFLPDRAKEFQIAMARWPRDGFRISLDIETSEGTASPVANSLHADGRNWYVGRLSP